MIYGKIFPTTRHSIHVRWIVRKATLNGPKRYGFELFLVSVSSFVGFGYFWAPKVTMRSVILKWAEALRIRVVFGIRELLRRFGYFWASKVTKKLNFVFSLT